MPYDLSWYIPHQVIHVVLDGEVSAQELQSMNQEVVEALERSRHKLAIVMDACNFKIGYQTSDHLRDSQKFMDHPNLGLAIVVADNKLIRLVTLMAFALSRTRAVQLQDYQKVSEFLRQRGFEAPSHV